MRRLLACVSGLLVGLVLVVPVVSSAQSVPEFEDVGATHQFAAAITWLASEGITRGCNPPSNDRFCPNYHVTRGQMAAFLHRAFGYPTPTTTRPTTTTTTKPLAFCQSQSSVPETECEALLALYNSTGGKLWKDNTGWSQNPDVCSWYGITCTTGHVTTVWLMNNNLSGSIPTTIGNLYNLEHLNLASNSLRGSIPTTIGNLYKLKSLDLSDNALTGSIPAEIGDLGDTVRDLRLHNNDLSGEIPDSMLNFYYYIDVTLHGQSGCLTESSPSNTLRNYLNGWDPLWNDGCAP